MAFAELCATSNFTFLTGGSHPQEYARRAAELGLPAFAIADRNSVAGVVRAHLETREIAREGGAAARLLPAARLRLLDGTELTALPRDRAGWGRLCRVLSDGARRARKGDCRLEAVDLDDLGDRRAAAAAPAPGAGAARLARPRPRAGRAAARPASGRRAALRRPGRRALRPPRPAGRGPAHRPRRLGRAGDAPRRPPPPRRRADLHPHRRSHRRHRPRRARQRRASAALGGRDAAAVRRARGGGPPRRRDRGELPLLARRTGLRIPSRDLGRRGPAGPPGPADRRGAALALPGRPAGQGPRPGRPRAGADRPAELRALLPHGQRRRELRPRQGHPVPGPRLGGQLGGLLRARHHLGLARDRHDGLRAVRLRGARRAARHRRRLRARAARGGDPVSLRPLRPPPRRALRDGDPLPRQAGDPRGRRGDGAVARHRGGARQPGLGLGRRRACRSSGWPSSASTRPTAGWR